MSLPAVKTKAGDTVTIEIDLRDADGVTPLDAVASGATFKWALTAAASSPGVNLAPKLLEYATGAPQITLPVPTKVRITIAKGTVPVVRGGIHELETTLATGQSWTEQAPFDAGGAAWPGA